MGKPFFPGLQKFAWKYSFLFQWGGIQCLARFLGRCPMRNFCNGNRTEGFTSMYRMHSEALGQILNATCKEEYESIKTAYQTDFIFNDKDNTDLSIYMPVLNVSKAITLTPEGFMYVSPVRERTWRSLKIMTDIKRTFFTLSLSRWVSRSKWYKQGLRENEERKFTTQIGMRGNQQAIRVNASKKFYGAGWNIRLRTIGNTRLTALYNLVKKWKAVMTLWFWAILSQMERNCICGLAVPVKKTAE